MRPEDAPSYTPSFGRKRGKKLKPTKQRLWEELLPEVRFEAGGVLPENLHLEIGYGSGEYLAHKAALYPERHYIGCEVYENGIATMLRHIDQRGLKNIRLYTDDARLLLETLPEGSVTGCDILFADPWPKKRHHRRRIINPETLDILSRLMPVGAKLFLATDHYDYLQWMMAQMLARNDFAWEGTWREPPADYVMTRYEAKARESGNHDINYLMFARI